MLGSAADSPGVSGCRRCLRRSHNAPLLRDSLTEWQQQQVPEGRSGAESGWRLCCCRCHRGAAREGSFSACVLKQPRWTSLGTEWCVGCLPPPLGYSLQHLFHAAPPALPQIKHNSLICSWFHLCSEGGNPNQTKSLLLLVQKKKNRPAGPGRKHAQQRQTPPPPPRPALPWGAHAHFCGEKGAAGRSMSGAISCPQMRLEGASGHSA